MPLTEVAIRNAKPEAKPVKLSDGQGMYLLIQPTGSKLWRLKYRFGGREKVLAIGQYPQITLKEARAAREDARKLLANDVDPGEHRKAVKQAGQDKAGNSFEVIAREWLTKYAPTWSPSHVETMAKRLERDIFPWLGSKPIADIKAPDLLIQLRRIEGRGALETAHRVLGTCGQVFRYAVATGRAERDPTGDLRGALPPAREKHHAAVIDGTLEPKEREKRVGELLRTLHDYKGGLIVASALRLAPLLFVRPGELRTMRWQDLDLYKAEWVYRVSKTEPPRVS